MAATLDVRERRRLRLRLLLFLVALALPAAALLWKALDQLKWEAMRESQLAAEELSARIDARLGGLVAAADARPFSDFAFLIVAGDPSAGFVQRSALAAFPVDAMIPGLIGWFQVDDGGRLSTPLLPAGGADAGRFGIGIEELAARQTLEQRIAGILGRNALVARPAPPPAAPENEQGRRGKLASDAQGPGLSSLSEARDGAEPAAAGAPPRAEQASGLVERTTRDEASAAAVAPSWRAAGGPARVPAPAAAQSQVAFERLAADAALQRLGAEGSATKSSPGSAAELDAASDGAVPGPADGTAPPASATPAAPKRRAPRVEQAALPEPMPPRREGQLAQSAAGRQVAGAREPARDETAAGTSATAARVDRASAGDAREHAPLVRTFQSELDPFRFSLLDSGHFVLFRWAWREGARYVQGALIDAQAFLDAVVGGTFRGSRLAGAAALEVDWGRQRLAAYRSAGGGGRYGYEVDSRRRVPEGTMLLRARPREPFGALSLTFRALRLPDPPGAALIYWLGAALALVLGLGTWLLYRVGLRQLALVRQQQDFVAAVSHELKTPLTSIRMYSEMLTAGWVDDAKRPRYYRFIHDESERLSRLVENVLQLARLGRGALRVQTRAVAAGELLEQARERLTSQASQAGFTLAVDCGGGQMLEVDPDAVMQILINLVDNALKFAAAAEPKRVDIGCGRLADGRVELRVRDYGPGIPKAERKRVLQLFQRVENEATRSTRGTGIGLALVERLTRAMGGEVELMGREPGIEVRLRFPAANQGTGRGNQITKASTAAAGGRAAPP